MHGVLHGDLPLPAVVLRLVVDVVRVQHHVTHLGRGCVVVWWSEVECGEVDCGVVWWQGTKRPVQIRCAIPTPAMSESTAAPASSVLVTSLRVSTRLRNTMYTRDSTTGESGEGGEVRG